MKILAFLLPPKNESLISLISFPKVRLLNLSPSENGNSGSISPSQNEKPNSLTPSLLLKLRTLALLPHPKMRIPTLIFFNPENQNTGLLLPSETENFEEEEQQPVGLVKIYSINLNILILNTLSSYKN